MMIPWERVMHYQAVELKDDGIGLKTIQDWNKNIKPQIMIRGIYPSQ